jgi:hypothetical protein
MKSTPVNRTPLPVSDDEMRLVRFFRCLDRSERWDLLVQVGQAAMDRCLPDCSVLSSMPWACGIQPEQFEGNLYEFIENDNTIVGILYYGIEATGEPAETLLGPGDDPDDRQG